LSLLVVVEEVPGQLLYSNELLEETGFNN